MKMLYIFKFFLNPIPGIRDKNSRDTGQQKFSEFPGMSVPCQPRSETLVHRHQVYLMLGARHMSDKNFSVCLYYSQHGQAQWIQKHTINNMGYTCISWNAHDGIDLKSLVILHVSTVKVTADIYSAMNCRLCLCFVPAESSISIYDDNDSLLELIRNCCQLKVQKNDTLPDSICATCKSKVLMFANFKRNCSRHDKTVRLRLSQCVPKVVTADSIWVNASIDDDEDDERLTDNGGKRPSVVDTTSCVDSTNIKVEEVILEDLVWENENFGSNPLPYSLPPIGESGLKNLNNHNSQNSGQGKKITSSVSRAQNSFNNPHSNKLNQCKICFKQFKSKQTLRTHFMKFHIEKKLKCKPCRKEFKTIITLEIHNSKCHSDKTLHKCKICSEAFETRLSLQAHTKQHTKKTLHKCKPRSKELKTKSSLQLHNKRHTDKTLHKCKICSKEFRKETKLKAHTKRHEAHIKYHHTYLLVPSILI
ncbi:uncharacterized protein LOC143912792 [Arctopsyche grandis]|uniref:uncharacterized protein LOC143912792 n=1 Tax=Arctopsyche grandis TaxID=121162 RepID=UPI00406D6905